MKWWKALGAAQKLGLLCFILALALFHYVERYTQTRHALQAACAFIHSLSTKRELFSPNAPRGLEDVSYLCLEEAAFPKATVVKPK
jgi:hypothetical protein